MFATWEVTAGRVSSTAPHERSPHQAPQRGEAFRLDVKQVVVVSEGSEETAANLKRFSFNMTSFRHQESQEALSVDSGFKHLTGTELISNLIQL